MTRARGPHAHPINNDNAQRTRMKTIHHPSEREVEVIHPNRAEGHLLRKANTQGDRRVTGCARSKSGHPILSWSSSSSSPLLSASRRTHRSHSLLQTPARTSICFPERPPPPFLLCSALDQLSIKPYRPFFGPGTRFWGPFFVEIGALSHTWSLDCVSNTPVAAPSAIRLD